MLKWKAELSVNVETIDNQHKRLIEIGAQIDGLLSLNDGADHYDEIMAILEELKEYTIYHFNFEEKLLEQNGYEDLPKHHFEHVFFVKKLERIGRKDIDGEQEETLGEIYNFVVNWITEHILVSDMKYRSYLNGRGVL